MSGTATTSRGRVPYLDSGNTLRTVDQLDVTGASPAVPTTSSWPSWPISRMSKSSAAKRRASACTLVTSGQVASIVRRLRALGLLMHHGGDAVRGEDHDRALGHLVGLVDEDRAALLETPYDVQVVHDLLAHVDGGAVQLEALLDRLDGAIDTRAVAPRLGEENPSGAYNCAVGHRLMVRRTARAAC